MKRFCICSGLLAGLILLCVCSLFFIRSECHRFGSLAASVTEAVKAEHTDDALERFDTLQTEWERFHNVCGLFVNGEQLDPIRESLSELRPLIEQAHPEAISALERLEAEIAGIYEEEFPALWHIV